MYSKDFRLNPKKSYSAPGELLVILNAEANQKVNKSIPVGPVRRIASTPPNSFGVEKVDAVLKKLQCRAITRIYPVSPAPNKTDSHQKIELSKRMSATYRLRFDDPEFDMDKAIDELKKLREVEEVCPNNLRFVQAAPNDTMYASQWGLQKINCPHAWNRTTGSSSVRVAIVDTGIDLNHPDLLANLVPGRDFVDLMGYGLNSGDIIPIDGMDFRIEGDVLTIDSYPTDEVGHGTHVAGIVGATTANAEGVAGVAWSCSLMPVRALFRIVRVSDGLVLGIGTDADIAAGIVWASDNGADIINLSLGGPSANPVQENAINYAMGNGCLVIAAMGNENSGSPSYPAAYPGVLSVGATDELDNKASFSNFGSHIDVVAPGVSVNSTYWDDTYTLLSGTSMATPFVSGLAALILSCNNSLSATQVADIIRQTSRPLRDNPADPVPNDNYGRGLIDARAAIDRACPIKSPILDNKLLRDKIVTNPSLDIRKFPVLDTIVTRPDKDVPKFPVLDELFTRPNRDFVKMPFLDKIPASDQLDFLHKKYEAPFVLSTPHHYQGSDKVEQTLEGYEEIFALAQEAYFKGELGEEDIQRLDEMYTTYIKLKKQ